MNQNQFVTTGIILTRIDYGEADRILTILTPDFGKLRVIAKGVRRVRSKLAGSIELFSVSDVTFIRGRGGICTLISARLIRHYGRIIQNLTRVQLGYVCIQLLNKNTEDEPDESYFILLERTLAALDDAGIDPASIQAWFSAQLLKLDGLVPNLYTDKLGNKLDATGIYVFSLDDMSFVASERGNFAQDHIKTLRILFGNYTPDVLQRLHIAPELLRTCLSLVQTIFSTSLRI